MVFDLDGNPKEVHYESEDARRYITLLRPLEVTLSARL